MIGVALTILIKDTLADASWKTPIKTAMTSPPCGMKEMTGLTMIGMLALLVAILVLNDLMM
jgi:hypothetical protein